MSEANDITICRHAAQKLLHWALNGAPDPCRGLLAGHGCRIDDALRLDGQAEEEAAAADLLHRQGLGLIGWFHSRTDGHEPDMDAMAALEQAPWPGPRPEMPLHLLVALDMKGRLELLAYVRNHAEKPARMPLRLVDDTPLYLDASRR